VTRTKEVRALLNLVAKSVEWKERLIDYVTEAAARQRRRAMEEEHAQKDDEEDSRRFFQSLLGGRRG